MLKWTLGAIVLAALVGVAMLINPLKAADGDKPAAVAKVGQPAPEFSLQNQGGQTVNLKDYAGKIVVLEWINTKCPFVVRHYNAKTMTTLADAYKDKDVVWLAINSTKGQSAAENKAWIDQHNIPYSILTDTDSTVAHTYGAKTTPHMFIIDKDGKLAYKGAIDDDPDGDKKEKVNYVSKALDELIAGSAVSTPETTSYGCGVK